MDTRNPLLETRRLRIRPIEKDDLEEVFSIIFSDPKIQARITKSVGSLDQIKNHFAARYIGRSDGYGYRVIIHKETNNIIGLIGFKPHSSKFNRPLSIGRDTDLILLEKELCQAELIYVLPSQFKGEGFTIEAARAMVAHGFQDLNLFRIVKAVHRGSKNSFLSMSRLGFRIVTPPRAQSKAEQSQSDIIGLLECYRDF